MSETVTRTQSLFFRDLQRSRVKRSIINYHPSTIFSGFKALTKLRCAWKPGCSSLAPYYEGILRYPSSLAPFQAPARKLKSLDDSDDFSRTPQVPWRCRNCSPRPLQPQSTPWQPREVVRMVLWSFFSLPWRWLILKCTWHDEYVYIYICIPGTCLSSILVVVCPPKTLFHEKQGSIQLFKDHSVVHLCFPNKCS